MKKNSAFTLVELLVVTGIFVAISTIISGILVSTLRSSEETTFNTGMTQSSNYALSASSDLIKRSKSILEVGGNPNACIPSQTGDSLKLEMVDGGVTTLECYSSTSTGTDTIASRSSTGDVVPYNDPGLVKINNCSFTCYQSSVVVPPRVEIQFDAHPANNVSRTSTYKTQISIRNYSY